MYQTAMTVRGTPLSKSATQSTIVTISFGTKASCHLNLLIESLPMMNYASHNKAVGQYIA
jgi:hypothetical protein